MSFLHYEWQPNHLECVCSVADILYSWCHFCSLQLFSYLLPEHSNIDGSLNPDIAGICPPLPHGLTAWDILQQDTEPRIWAIFFLIHPPGNYIVDWANSAFAFLCRHRGTFRVFRCDLCRWYCMIHYWSFRVLCFNAAVPHITKDGGSQEPDTTKSQSSIFSRTGSLLNTETSCHTVCIQSSSWSECSNWRGLALMLPLKVWVI